MDAKYVAALRLEGGGREAAHGEGDSTDGGVSCVGGLSGRAVRAGPQEEQAAAEAAEAEAAKEEELRARLAALGPDSDEEYADSVVEEGVEPQVELQDEAEGDGREAAPPINQWITELNQQQEARNLATEADRKSVV